MLKTKNKRTKTKNNNDNMLWSLAASLPLNLFKQ